MAELDPTRMPSVEGDPDEDSSRSISINRRHFIAGAASGAIGLAGCSGTGGQNPTEVPNPVISIKTPTPGTSTRTPTARDPPGRVPPTLIATWRGHDPTSSITLQWLATDAEWRRFVRVELTEARSGESAADVWARRTPFGDESGLFRHRAVLAGLEEATRFRITIGGVDTGLEVETAPSVVSRPLTFVEGGDIGTSDAVPVLHRHAARTDPLFGLVGGDLAYADGTDANRWITFLNHWSEHMRSGNRLIPIVAAIGHHEVSGGMHASPEEAPLFYTLFDNTRRRHAYWALDVGEDLSILLLDSNHTTEVPGEQTSWLERALDDRRDRKFLMAAYHVPAYPSVYPIDDPRRDREDVRDHWVPLFEEFRVDVAFEHDDHAYKRTHPLRDGEPDTESGILYLGDGAWGQGPNAVKSPVERPYLARSRSRSRRHVIATRIVPNGRRAFRVIDIDGRTIDWFIDGRPSPRG